MTRIDGAFQSSVADRRCPLFFQVLNMHPAARLPHDRGLLEFVRLVERDEQLVQGLSQSEIPKRNAPRARGVA